MCLKQKKPKSPGRKRLYAGLAAGLGISLVLFELRELSRTSSIEFSFWLLVGLLLAIIGSIEFFSIRDAP